MNGEWADNPFTMWNEINPDLPAIPILIYGPLPTSGTRDAFVELAMWPGCEELEFVTSNGFDDDWIEENCSAMRQDGPFVEAGENGNLIVQRLVADPNSIGIFGYSFMFENKDQLKGVNINGVEPLSETIASFDYPIARPLYFYVKNAHRGVIPGLNEFIAEYASEAALGDGGYLQERGPRLSPATCSTGWRRRRSGRGEPGPILSPGSTVSSPPLSWAFPASSF